MTLRRNDARVIVIGGGIGGCSVAYHLAVRGMENVILLERSALSSGTTWHSTGNMETYRDDPCIFEMVQYAADIYPKLAAQAGRDIGWRNVGRVMYTDNKERWKLYQTLPELGRIRGIEVDLLTPADLVKRLPIIAADDLMGGVWVPSDARVNPTDAVMVFAKAAKTLNVEIRTETEVLGIVVHDGTIQGVETTAGIIGCEIVVVAAGIWSADVLGKSGFALPLYALEHQYIITNTQGIDRNLPLFISFDDQLYGREEVGGLLVGSLDDHAVPLSLSELPQNFSFALLNERWEQFEPYLQTAMRRFPVLRTATIKMLLNGPESFTPDGQMLLGPVPGASGLYVSCGFNSNGMALAPAAGRYVAEWIAEGAPSADVAQLDVRRFSATQCEEEYLRDRVTEIPSYYCRLHTPETDYTTARDMRRSPLHEKLAAAGARFGAVNAWERPLWIAQHPSAGTWVDSVAIEVEAATNDVLVVDRSADVKVLVNDEIALSRLMLRGTSIWPKGTLLRPLTGSYDEMEALVSVLDWQHGQVLVVASPDQDTRVLDWLRRFASPGAVSFTDVTQAYSVLEIVGPKRRDLLVRAGLVTQTASDTSHAGKPESATPYVHHDELLGSTLVTTHSERAEELWRRISEAGREIRLRAGGHFAREAIRIGHGIPQFGREATPARLARELVCSRRGTTGFYESGYVPRTHQSRVLAAFDSPLDDMGFGSGEAIIRGGRTVGVLTSRVRLPGWPATLALGIVEPQIFAADGINVVSAGRKWPLALRKSRWSEAQ